MKKPISLSLLFLAACGPLPPDPLEFLYDFERTKFKTTRMRSFDSSSWIVPTGLKTYLFDGQNLSIDHQNYNETGVNPCYNDAVYEYKSYDYDSFVKALDSGGILTEEEQEQGGSYYDIFEPYKNEVENTSGDDEEKAEVIRFYFIGELDADNTNISCNVNYEQTYYYQINFYRDGDLEFFDHNRKILFLAKPQ